MFWIALKVLFIRQMYSLKHRWIVFLICLAYTVVWLYMLVLIAESFPKSSSGKPPKGTADNLPSNRQPDNSSMFGGTGTVGVPDPLEVVVMPHNRETEGLLFKAYQDLERQYNSSLNVHLRFAESDEHLNRALVTSTWPSIGLTFHKMAAEGLEYTVRPVIRPQVMTFFQPHAPPSSPSSKYIDEYSNWILRLRVAIDTAYIHKHFPNKTNLRIQRLPNFPMSDDEQLHPSYVLSLTIHFLAHFLVSLSLLFIMSMLASYVITDKLSGMRELLCVYGLPRWMVNVTWLMFFCLLAINLAIMQTVMLKVPPSSPYLSNIDSTLLGIFLTLNNWTALVFVNVVANLLTHKMGTIMLIILYWTATGMICVFLVSLEFDKQLSAQALLSLLPNFGTATFFSILTEHKALETELSFGNLFSSSKKFISPGLVLIMMVLGILIFLALAVYLDFVKPGPYGRAIPWYLYKRKDKIVDPPQGGSSDPVLIEQLEDERIGLRCVNIVKAFGTNKALNNVNLSIVKNKVTVLLGHNGAGKTTLFSILCGMFSPTSGEVYTDEYSVFEGSNLTRFRSSLGYCPQQNLLLNELTVEEHLIVFGMLKGWSKSEAREFSNKWARMFDMDDRRNTQAKHLSGGTKRKLCLAIAMTGKPKFLLLDEPSAGMDIESTRKFWNVLLKEKGNCTVIITTHDMDEADILGDRIAILAHGQLKCLGSSSFLKKNMDSGYRLNCAVLKRNTQDVIKAVKRIVRNAATLYKTNRSVTFSIPGNMEKSIPDLLRGLEAQFGETVSTTLSVSTLDDVFIQVQKDTGVKVAVEELPIIPEEEMHRSCWNFADLFMRRVRWILSTRLAVMILVVILLPCLGMIGSLYFTYALMSDSEDQRPDGGSGGMFAVISNTSDAVSSILRSTLTNSGIIFTESSKDVKSTLNDLAQQDLYKYRSNLLFAFDRHPPDTPTAFFPKRADLSVYAAYGALINALLQGNATIVTHYSPLVIQTEFVDSGLICVQTTDILEYIAVVPFFLVGGVFILVASSYFTLFPHEERASLFKHLLLMTGLLPEAYWLANLIFDMLIFLCACAMLITIGAIMDHYLLNILMEPTVTGSLILVLLLYGVCSIIFSYIWSFIFKAVSIPILIQILGSLSITFGVRILASYTEKVDYEWSFFIPWSILWSSITKIFVWAIHNAYCGRLEGSCKLLGCSYVKEHPSLGGELTVEYASFTVLIAGYILFLLFLDHGLGRDSIGLAMNVLCGRINYSDDKVNSEVALEKERVDHLVKEGPEDQPEIVVDGLGKNYCKRTAVYDVTFTAEQGECFGLVGVNGAGKSTTFRMLVALTRPTKGTAVIEGQWKVTGCTYNYLKRLGYCPQSDGLLKELSARNILRLFGRVGGVPRDQIGPLVDKWIAALDMTTIANRPCGQYSGGNKRKLSLAISLIGNPPVALLDEPTAGVDPIVRRKIYEMLTATLENNRKTIILTSHTMSECESICDRLTIMVKGVMKCLGPIPMLKKLFGKGCQLEVKFKTNSKTSTQTAVQSKIESQFKGYISLKEIQPSRLVFTLKTEEMKIHDVFETMLSIKSNNPIIEEFNLAETPLEQVFLMFAQK